MRHLFISVAALALTAAGALAQPGYERGGRERGADRGQADHPQNVGKASMGREVQDRAQAELRGGPVPPPQQTAQGGGPTNFTNQIQGQQPDQGQIRGERGDRGRGPQQQAPQAQPQVVAPQPQAQDRGRDDGNRGNWQGRGNRGNAGGFDNRAGFDNRRDDGRDRFNGQGRGGFDNRAGFDDGRRFYDRRGYDNRRDWDRDRGYRSGYNGPRRDFSGFRNYHREFRAPHRFRAPTYRRPSGFYDRRWAFGDFLPRAFWARDYWLDYSDYDLPQPPYGALWVRVDDDALLIDRDSGEIITIAYNIFY